LHGWIYFLILSNAFEYKESADCRENQLRKPKMRDRSLQRNGGYAEVP